MIDTGNNKQVLQATNNAKIAGISQDGARQVPLNDLVTTNLAAQAGEYVAIFSDSDTDKLLEIGAAVTAGDSLRSDANGRGVTATSGQNVGAQALEDGAAAGELIKVAITTVRNAV
jgi:hypothetical protein